MSIHDFYAKFVSDHDKSPLFVALRKLSQFENPIAAFDLEDASAWSAWDATGGPPEAASRFIADPA